MRRAITLLVLLYAFLLVSPAIAATVQVSWTNPTSYVDNSPLVAADITRTRIQYGSCGTGGAFGTVAGEFISTGNDTTEVSPNLTPGTYCFRAFTTARGVESAASNVSSSVIAQPAPRPPTIIEIILAWLRRAFGRFA